MLRFRTELSGEESCFLHVHWSFSSLRYFIAQDAEEVRRVTVFCKVEWQYNLYNILTKHFQSCHEQVKAVNLVTKCKCAILKEESERRQKSID